MWFNSKIFVIPMAIRASILYKALKLKKKVFAKIYMTLCWNLDIPKKKNNIIA